MSCVQTIKDRSTITVFQRQLHLSLIPKFNLYKGQQRVTLQATGKTFAELMTIINDISISPQSMILKLHELP